METKKMKTERKTLQDQKDDFTRRENRYAKKGMVCMVLGIMSIIPSVIVSTYLSVNNPHKNETTELYNGMTTTVGSLSRELSNLTSRRNERVEFFAESPVCNISYDESRLTGIVNRAREDVIDSYNIFAALNGWVRKRRKLRRNWKR